MGRGNQDHSIFIILLQEVWKDVSQNTFVKEPFHRLSTQIEAWTSFEGDSPFAFLFNFSPRNAHYSGYKIKENISSAKPTQAQSTFALHTAVTFVSRILYDLTRAQKTKRTCRSQCPDCFPAAKYYHYCLANTSLFSRNTECKPLWISQLPSLRVKL